ncbi:virulence factor Mce family protein [Tomitella cavernea]|uniref:Virulence factor Mce family protein n=2 Tax=Tomitella cavernea TaxID=1387982 RepID=A0ABP9CJK8_9ACTN
MIKRSRRSPATGGARRKPGLWTRLRSLPRFRDMNPIPIAIIGLVLTAAVVLGALQYDKLPFINSATGYQAQVADAAGLKSGDDVFVAGLKVGKVGSIGLQGDHVVVDFTVDSDIRLGKDTVAAISTESMLGKRGLQVRPVGAGDLGEGGVIPLSHTSTPYALTEALGDLATNVGEIDTDAVTEALESFSDSFADAPEELRGALDGVTRLSKSISSRDQQLQDLLKKTNGVTGVLKDRSEQLNALVVDANSLMAKLDERKQMLNQLIVHIGAVSTQLTGFVEDNEQQLKPALDNLHTVMQVMEKNYANISDSLDGVTKYMYALGDSVANGPYFLAYIQNFLNAMDYPGGVQTTDMLKPLLAQMAQQTPAAAQLFDAAKKQAGAPAPGAGASQDGAGGGPQNTDGGGR